MVSGGALMYGFCAGLLKLVLNDGEDEWKVLKVDKVKENENEKEGERIRAAWKCVGVAEQTKREKYKTK